MEPGVASTLHDCTRTVLPGLAGPGAALAVGSTEGLNGVRQSTSLYSLAGERKR